MLSQACLRLLLILPLAYHPFTRLMHATRLGKPLILCNMGMQYSRNLRVLSNALEVTRFPKSDMFITKVTLRSSENNVDGLGSI